MKYSRYIVSGYIALSLLLGSCGESTTGGPQTWIDKPLDNTTAPLAPMSIMVHASDSEGVASLEFSVDGQPYKVVSVNGARMETRTINWNPAGPGTYRIEARAVDTNGNIGSTATSLVIILGDVEEIPIQDDVITVTPSNTPKTITITITVTPTPTRTPTPTVTQPPPPPDQPPPPPEPPPPPPPSDTTPPGVYGGPSGAVINPGYLYKAGPGCDDEPRTAASNLVAYDETGIARIYGNWSITDSNGSVVESGYVTYSLVNPELNGYSGTYGPVNHDGTMYIYGTVEDTSGNTAPFYHTITVYACIL